MTQKCFPSWIVAWMLALLPCAWSGRAEAQQSSTPEGQQIFAARCATCHGLDGQGGERGPNVANRREVQQLSDKALLQIVQKGIPTAGMPSFRALGSTNIEALVQYLRVLQGRAVKAQVRGDLERGKALFSGKAGCSQCHTVNGEGGFLGPDLTTYAVTQSAEDVRGAITDPNKNLDPRYQTVVVTAADGTTSTGIARNEDNFSLLLQTPDGVFHSLSKSELQNIEHQSHSLMPDDYGSKLSHREIDDVISYLVKIARAYPERKLAKIDN